MLDRLRLTRVCASPHPTLTDRPPSLHTGVLFFPSNILPCLLSPDQCVCDKLFLRQLVEGILPLPNPHICCLKGLIGFFTFCPAGGYEVTKRISEIDSESLSWYSDFTAKEQSNSKKVIISHFNKQRNCVHFKE